MRKKQMKFKTGLGVIPVIDGFTGFVLVLSLSLIVFSAVLVFNWLVIDHWENVS